MTSQVKSIWMTSISANYAAVTIEVVQDCNPKTARRLCLNAEQVWALIDEQKPITIDEGRHDESNT